MNSKRLYQLLIGAIIGIGGLGVASVYYGQGLLTSKSTELDTLKVKRAALEEQERSLVQAKSEITEYELLQTVSTSIVPQEKDQARTIREIVAIADSSGVQLSGITFPTSELGEEKSKIDSSETQLEKVEGIPGLSQLELTVNIQNLLDYPTMIGFLERLERNRRTSSISSLIITPVIPDGSDEIQFQLGLTVQVFIKP